jgi:diacylglycerol kinase (ATP)
MIRLLVNPTAGCGRLGGTLEAIEKRCGVQARRPATPADVTLESRAAAADGIERLIVAGGDGTLHHAVRGLAGTDCALGIIPCGTGNDFARALDLSLDPIRACETALSGSPRRIDLGRIGDTPFLGVAAVGFVGNVLRFLQSHPSRSGGAWTYALAVLRTLFSFVPPTARVDLADVRLEGPIVIVAVANSPVFGGGMRIAPDARLDDGRLELVYIEQMSRIRLLTTFPRIYRGTHVRLSAVRTHSVERTVLHLDPEQTIYADGEPVAQTAGADTAIEVWPAALSVIA